ncbi:hypothetical protein JCM12178A_03710 [Salidesulfovibrio brasiliensis]
MIGGTAYSRHMQHPEKLATGMEGIADILTGTTPTTLPGYVYNIAEEAHSKGK